MSGLIVRVGGSDGQRILTPVGELDMATAGELESALDVWRDGPTDLVLDLRELDFIDSTGVRLMIEVVKCCQAAGCQFEVIRGCDGVQRIFDLCGLSDAVPFRNGQAPRPGQATPGQPRLAKHEDVLALEAPPIPELRRGTAGV